MQNRARQKARMILFIDPSSGGPLRSLPGRVPPEGRVLDKNSTGQDFRETL
jgi:hypothetical protein